MKMNILTGGVRKNPYSTGVQDTSIVFLFIVNVLLLYLDIPQRNKDVTSLPAAHMDISCDVKITLISRFFKRAQSSIRAGTFVKDNSCAQSAVDIFRSMFYYYCIIMYLMNESTCVLMTTTIAYSHSVLGMFMKCFMRCLLVQRHDV